MNDQSFESFNILKCPLNQWVLLEASAGTGKTWNIAGLYLRLLAEKMLTVQQILVMTFTRAAANELKDRLRKRIEETLAILKSPDISPKDPFIDQFISHLKDNDHDLNIVQNILELAFQSFDQAAIFTIHGFCQRALAIAAFSSGLPFSQSVENDDEELINETVNDFWRNHLAGEKQHPFLIQWLKSRSFSPDALKQLLKRRLDKPMAKEIWPSEITSNDDTLNFEAAITELKSCFITAKICWENTGKEAIDCIIQSAQSSLNRRTYTDNVFFQLSENCQQLFSDDNLISLIGNHQIYRYCCSSYLQKMTKKGKDTPQHHFFDCMDSLLTAIQMMEQQLETTRLKLIYKFLNTAPDQITLQKKEQQTISYMDMLFNLHKALRQHTALSNTLKWQFPAALIDEFQDTDTMQYDIFSWIYAPDDPVFMVGDPKQAIYSFRGADLHTYLMAKEGYRHTKENNSLHVTKIPIRRYYLETNFRSSPALIQACNHLFEQNPQAFFQEGITFNKVKIPLEKSDQLIDENHIFPHPFTVYLLNDASSPPLQQDATEHSLEIMADEIATIINEGTIGKLRIKDNHGERNVCSGDIAVLVRSHRHAQLVQKTLERRGIASITHSQESVFDSSEALELEHILYAIRSPMKESHLRAALATEMLGRNAIDLFALNHNEGELPNIISRFDAYHQLWLRKGIAFALQQMINQEGILKRLLIKPDGERRLTNLRHLLEMISKESQVSKTPDALLRWYHNRRIGKKRADDDELRLETDNHLVQVITFHRSKGLEYPFVFCPLIWSVPSIPYSGLADGKEYIQPQKLSDTNQLSIYNHCIDFMPQEQSNSEDYEKIQQIDRYAEDIRLIYVALTRAKYRCTIVAGCYYEKRGNGKSDIRSRRHPLNWLSANWSITTDDWLNGRQNPTPESNNSIPPLSETIAYKWNALNKNQDAFHVTALPQAKFIASTFHLNQEDPKTLHAAIFNRKMRPHWRMNSFSGLIEHSQLTTTQVEQGIEPSPRDMDNYDKTHLSLSFENELTQQDICDFPTGTYAGSCIHAVFEQADFSEYSNDKTSLPNSWNNAIKKALQQYPQILKDRNAEESYPSCQQMLYHMLQNVLNTPLTENILLKTIPMEHRLSELPFCFQSADFSGNDLNKIVKAFSSEFAKDGIQFALLSDDRIRTYLNGVIDLIFEHNGRFYVLDWKSNHLGNTSENYSTANIMQEMNKHGYHWQYLLYTIALHRFLKNNIQDQDYDYDKHIGGVLYLFIRGIRPDWKNIDGSPTGVFYRKPSKALITSLDQVFNNPAIDIAASANY